MSEAYKAAGVDVEAGYMAVKLMKQHVEKTFTSGVLTGIGGFGGLFELPQGYNRPVLVSGTDGVGTKLKLAFVLDKHDTVGQDCVAMCVNDIICCGAKPLFFLDYIATGKNVPEKIADIVKGIADGCVMSDCALIGGETAEMPGFYPEDEYDLAGFSVGIVDKDKIVDGSAINTGDALIGIASSGVHSNGFSLIRKIFDGRYTEYSSELSKTIGESLLTPTKIYVKPLLDLMSKVDVKAVSHITGGGFYENIPRMLKDGTSAKIDINSYPVLPIFNLAKSVANLSQRDLYNTFNMGIGMIIAVSSDKADEAVRILKQNGEDAYIIGEVVSGNKEVIL